MYTYIIGFDDELWDIIEDGINTDVNSVGMVKHRKILHLIKRKLTENIIELKAF